MKRSRTRNERRARAIAQTIRVTICVTILLVLIVLFGQAAAQEAPVNGSEYLNSMGVPAEQQEHIFGVICDVHC